MFIDKSKRVRAGEYRFDIKSFLKESYTSVKKKFDIDIRNGRDILQLLDDNKAFNYYTEALLSPFSRTDDRIVLRSMLENTKSTLLWESSRNVISPYEKLSFPLIPIFYPRLISKELVTFVSTDNPEPIVPILKGSFRRFGSTVDVPAPASADMSVGPTVGIPGSYNILLPADASTANRGDILAAAGVAAGTAHVERNLEIIDVTDGTDVVTVNKTATVDGNFYFQVTYSSGNVDIITGMADYLNGKLILNSINGFTTSVNIQAQVSVEENNVTTRLTPQISKIRVPVRDRQLEMDYTYQLLQDAKSLYNIDVEEWILDLAAMQIANDIDNEILGELYGATTNANLVPVSHTLTFSKNIPAPGTSNFALGPMDWDRNIMRTIDKVSGAISNDSKLGLAKIIVCNDIDSYIFSSFHDYYVDEDAEGVTAVGYVPAGTKTSKLEIFHSPNVPQNKILVMYKPTGPKAEQKTVYYFAMHTPGLIHPNPKGNKPTLSLLTRYGTSLIQPSGLGRIDLV